MKPLKESGTAPVVHRRSGKIAKVSKLFSAVSHSRSTKGDDERDEDTPPTFEADIFETNYPDADRSHSDETETNTDADDLSVRSISTLTPENEREEAPDTLENPFISPVLSTVQGQGEHLFVFIKTSKKRGKKLEALAKERGGLLTNFISVQSSGTVEQHMQKILDKYE